MTSDEFETWVYEQNRSAKESHGKILNDEPIHRTLYEESYAKATEEQRKKLGSIFADKFIKLPGEWIRDVLITTGDLPESTKRLTIDYVKSVLEKLETRKHTLIENGIDIETTLINEFNKLAGAPDWETVSFLGESPIETATEVSSFEEWRRNHDRARNSKFKIPQSTPVPIPPNRAEAVNGNEANDAMEQDEIMTLYTSGQYLIFDSINHMASWATEIVKVEILDETVKMINPIMFTEKEKKNYPLKF